MHTYNVFFEDAFWGYAWADTAWDAILKVVGDYGHDSDGERDYRWRAELVA